MLWRKVAASYSFRFLTGMTTPLVKIPDLCAMLALGQCGFRHPTSSARLPNGQKVPFSHRFIVPPCAQYALEDLQ
jgi:hypothetical protein